MIHSIDDYAATHLDDQDRQEVHAAVNEAERILDKVGVDYDFGKDCEVHTVSQMGEAAGTWYVHEERMEAREDLLLTVEGRQKLTHVLVHEALHANGNHYEGFVEDQAARLTDEKAMCYSREIRAAQDFFRVVDRDHALELATEENADTVLLLAYVQERVHQGIDWVTATQTGRELLETAKG